MKISHTKKKSAKRRPTHPTPKPKATRPRQDLAPVVPDQVILVRTKGASGRGGGSGGEAWRIDAKGKRAGIVFINVIDEPPFGKHASIQIFLNQPHQGRKIGRTAYRKAAEASEHTTIYAHMRKSNIASRRAAEEAGFSDVTPSGHPQLIMMRQRAGA
ncbi:GNAT family N-acetyltransferase [Bradyrhizobium elkanii]